VLPDDPAFSEAPDRVDRTLRFDAAHLARSVLMSDDQDAVFAQHVKLLRLDPVAAPVIEEVSK
jgi:hypothetical protein